MKSESGISTYIRDIVNEFYSKPVEMTTLEFCKSHKIRKYQLDRYIEIVGQRMGPHLAGFAKRSLDLYYECPPTYYQQLRELWRECSEMIDREVLISKRRKRRKDVQPSEFEHIRFKLLIDIAMIPESYEIFETLRKLHNEVLDVYPF